MEAPGVRHDIKKKSSLNHSPHYAIHLQRSEAEAVEGRDQEQPQEKQVCPENPDTQPFSQVYLVSPLNQTKQSESYHSNATSLSHQNRGHVQFGKPQNDTKQILDQLLESSAASRSFSSPSSSKGPPKPSSYSALDTDSVIVDGFRVETKPTARRRPGCCTFSFSSRVDPLVLLLFVLVFGLMFQVFRLQIKTQELENILMRRTGKAHVTWTEFPLTEEDEYSVNLGIHEQSYEKDDDDFNVDDNPPRQEENLISGAIFEKMEETQEENSSDVSSALISVLDQNVILSRAQRSTGAKSKKQKAREKKKKRFKRAIKDIVMKYLEGLHEKIDNLTKFMVRSNRFNATFYNIFDYDDFKNDDCVNYNNNPRITACKNSTINFEEKGSHIPFYQEVKLRQVESKKADPPQAVNITEENFKVLMSGVYLVSANITMVDDSHEKFLAIYLNDKAMFVCPRGGFRCPEVNYNGHASENRHRICNMGGVLQLNKGDILDVRTMAAHTKVRIQDDRRSIFSIVLLYGNQD